MQAGLYRAILTEAKNLSINYSTFAISGGDEIMLNTKPVLTIESNDTLYNYTLSAQLNDLTQPQIDQINDSIYGWIAKLEFFDLTTKIIERPFFALKNTDVKTNVSHSRMITLNSWNRQGLIAFN